LRLGLTIAEGSVGVALLAGILVGNVVEAYGAAQPIATGGRSGRFAVGLLGGIGLVLAGATVLGAALLADVDETAVGFPPGARGWWPSWPSCSSPSSRTRSRR
jgi:hypothetical protein